jgi:ABC-2 type transport system ATP-binding protein
MSEIPIPAIQLKSLTKSYADAIVVDKLSLEVPCGCIFGFFGPNGAGKSTTVKMMAGLVAPDCGDALLMGQPISADAVEVKRIIGVVPDDLALFEYLSIWEHLDLIRSLFDLEAEAFRHRSAQQLKLLGLSAAARKLVRHCSYGMRKKTSLAMALLPNPKILILDEPFEGLDPVMCVTVKRALKRASENGTTIFLTTHVLNSIDDLVDRYGIIRAGILVAQGDVASLTRQGVTIEDAYLKEFPVPESENLEWLG